MTSILAFKKNEKAYAVSDSQIEYVGLKESSKQKKCLKINDEYYIFIAGNLRILDIIIMNLEALNFPIENYKDTLTLAEKLRSFCEKSKLDIEKSENTFDLVLVKSDSIYKIAQDFSVIEVDEVCVAGTGSEMCLGVYEALKDTANPEVILKKAIEVADKYSPYSDNNPMIATFD